MGCNPLAWLFGEQEEPSKREKQEKREKHEEQENQSEQLVLGAELHCPYGSENSYLIVPADRTCINGLPRACVLDRKELENILPFGQCALGGPCEDLMELEERWENPEPQKVTENGEEIITTKSKLICKKNWIIISAVTSGQDGVAVEQWREQAEWARGMEEKYPGLLAILMDPYGSLYLNEGMYQTALRFLEDCIEKNGGEIPLAKIYVPESQEEVLIKATLAHLLPSIDTKRQESFLSVLEARGVATNMYDSPGWDAHVLNGAMMDMLKKDCANMAELIETNTFYRWSEEHKQSLSIVADSITDFTYGLIIYNSMMLASENTVCSRDSWLNKGANKIKNSVKKIFNGEAEAGAGGGPKTNFENEIPRSGEEWDKFLKEKYGSENVVWESKGDSNTWNRNLIDARDINTGDFLSLKNNGVVQVNSSGSNRPLTGTPNSYYSTANGEHIFVYDNDGKLIYDMSNVRVKGFKINIDPNGIEHYQPYKLIGSIPEAIKQLFGW